MCYSQYCFYLILEQVSVAWPGGGLEPPHWIVKYAKSHVFGAFEADILWKIENSPPIGKQPPLIRLNFRFRPKTQSQFRWRPFFFFFWRPPDFGLKKRLNFRFWSKNQSQFRWRPSFFFFFGDHLILGWKNVWIFGFGRKISLNFGEDLFFGDNLTLGWKNVWISVFGRKISLNFSEDLFFFFFFFFLEITWFWAEKTIEFPSFPRNSVLVFGETVWNWFRNNENSGQGSLHFSHSFKKVPPPPFPNPGYAPGRYSFNSIKNSKVSAKFFSELK